MAKDKESPGTQVVAWQEELNALAVQQSQAEKPSAFWISFRNGQLKINDTRLTDDKLECVIIQSIFENQWYKNKFNPNVPENPMCYAFAEIEDDLVPHKDGTEPQNEGQPCEVCPKNAWGSDPDGGRGKACKNTRRLAVISATDLKTPEGIMRAEVAMCKLPVTSVKNWSTYSSQITNVLKKPVLAVRTEISCVPDPNVQLKVNFRFVEAIDDPEILQALLKKRSTIRDLIFAPYEKNQPQQPQQPRKF